MLAGEYVQCTLFPRMFAPAIGESCLQNAIIWRVHMTWLYNMFNVHLKPIFLIKVNRMLDTVNAVLPQAN